MTIRKKKRSTFIPLFFLWFPLASFHRWIQTAKFHFSFLLILSLSILFDRHCSIFIFSRTVNLPNRPSCIFNQFRLLFILSIFAASLSLLLVSLPRRHLHARRSFFFLVLASSLVASFVRSSLAANRCHRVIRFILFHPRVTISLSVLGVRVWERSVGRYDGLRNDDRKIVF